MNQNFSLDGLFDFSDLDETTQQHLRQVYSHLSFGMVIAIICFILAQFFPQFSLIFITLGIISFIADIALIFMNRNTPRARRASLASLYGYASSVGGSLGSYIARMDTESRVLNYRYCLSAFVSVLIIFSMFSIFSILTSNRTGVYAFSTIGAIVLSLFSFFYFGYSAIIGVILGALYVITDTQNIIYRAKNSGSDAIQDAKMLFIDLVKMFYKLYEYFQKKEDKKKKEKKKKKY